MRMKINYREGEPVKIKIETGSYELVYLCQTKLAVKVRDPVTDNEFWLPKSQTETIVDLDDLDEGDETLFTIPYWLAEEHELEE